MPRVEPIRRPRKPPSPNGGIGLPPRTASTGLGREDRTTSAMPTIDKTMDAAAVVSRLRDGMVRGIGGWGARRKPMALVREILRSDLTDLTLVSYGGPEVG